MVSNLLTVRTEESKYLKGENPDMPCDIELKQELVTDVDVNIQIDERNREREREIFQLSSPNLPKERQ